MSEWWSMMDMGRLGAITGTACGVLGSVIGCAGGILVPRGRGKGVVYGLLGLGIAIGAVSLVMAVVALGTGQPRHVLFPLALVGVVMLGSTLPFSFFVPRLYRQAEARRLQAEELRRGT